VWTSESGDFTPWLAENIDVLADALDMTLTVVATEVRIGDFRLDIHAKDGNDRSVVIENQLERTDHGHLGQCLVYASGLDAATVIWVAPNFREEFRSALDWRNEHTDSELGFFGVEIGIVQIGHGPPAPVFDIVSGPQRRRKQSRPPAPPPKPAPPLRRTLPGKRCSTRSSPPRTPASQPSRSRNPRKGTGSLLLVVLSGPGA
jgi:hypothetical protein